MRLRDENDFCKNARYYGPVRLDFPGPVWQASPTLPTAAGPDGIPAWFLRLLAPELAIPLAHIYNLSIIQSVVPSQWKVARIVPIPKIKNPAELSDFRPLSITSIISRQLEKFVVQEYLYPASTEPSG